MDAQRRLPTGATPNGTKVARLFGVEAFRVKAAIKTPCGRAPGYRSNSTGTLYGIGEGGYSYSSSVNGSKGMYLGWDATWLLSNNANNRGHGLQLRCLSE